MRLAAFTVLFAVLAPASAQPPGHECCYLAQIDRHAEEGSVTRYYKIRDVPLPGVNNLWCNSWMQCVGDRDEAAARERDPAERLRMLRALRDEKLLTPAEYEAKRAEILKGL